MIELRRRQMSFAEGLIAEEVGDLWEDWMRQVDALLEDPELLNSVYEALALRWPKSRTRGRKGTPADVVLRMLLLKHMRNWSYAIVEREVRANLVYRQFTRVGGNKVPDAREPGQARCCLGAGSDRADSSTRGGHRAAEENRGGQKAARRYHRG